MHFVRNIPPGARPPAERLREIERERNASWFDPDAALQPPPLQAYAEELDRRDAANPVRCDGCGGRHGAVLVCGGCEEPVEDCVCSSEASA